ncbi:hypothetical protein [Brachybacterium phenoliresistens]|uniref:Uncharacterized protein n=1 Tax=Brachybacterium phenoliresistens TaxID=396014 RepID=Z9JT04_9MICO|nr:hypothetical protein [Brachybacterium phenoliresistens]EWS80892.1 hypothetical protein BF93_00540 [Brachybacterium phenoliresistens]
MISIIQGFLSGEISDAVFLEELCGDRLDGLRHWPNAPAYVPHRDLMQYLLLADIDTPDGRYAVTSVLEEYLRDHGAAVAPTTRGRKAASDYELLLDVQPRWLDVTGDEMKELLAAAADAPEDSRRAQLKAMIKERYRYLRRPPRWLQSPQWPLVEQRAAVFVGQLDVSALHHDTAHLYVFVDEHSGNVVTVTQQM